MSAVHAPSLMEHLNIVFHQRKPKNDILLKTILLCRKQVSPNFKLPSNAKIQPSEAAN